MRVIAVGLSLTVVTALDSCASGGDSPELEAAFSAQFDHTTTGSTSCPVTAIRFTDESTGEPTSWDWQFEEGETSEQQHPTWETSAIVAEAPSPCDEAMPKTQ